MDGNLIKNVFQSKEQVEELMKNVGNFKERAFSGELFDSQIRSIYWMTFLGVLNSKDITKWRSEISFHRKRYTKLVEKYYKFDPKAMDEEDLSVNNPLSMSTDNVWGEYFKDEELKRMINRDLERLFPEYPFFKSDDIQQMMLKILFIWSKMNPEYSYKQGFHDLLAVFVLVKSRDCNYTKDDVTYSDSKRVEAQEVLCDLFDKQYIEHDCFEMFSRLLVKVRKFYGKKEKEFSPRSRPIRKKRSGVDTMKRTEIYKICENVQKKILRVVDPALYEKLETLGIQPQVFLLKWIRLLFLRCFHIDQVMMIWDVFFALNEPFFLSSKTKTSTKKNTKEEEKEEETCHFDLIEHICLNMMLLIRDRLLNNGIVQCLECLMGKFPPSSSFSKVYAINFNEKDGNIMKMMNAKKMSEVDFIIHIIHCSRRTMANPGRVIFPKVVPNSNSVSEKMKRKRKMKNSLFFGTSKISTATKKLIDGENTTEKLTNKYHGKDSGFPFSGKKNFQGSSSTTSNVEKFEREEEKETSEKDGDLDSPLPPPAGYEPAPSKDDPLSPNDKSSSSSSSSSNGVNASKKRKRVGNRTPQNKIVISSPKIKSRTYLRKSDVNVGGNSSDTNSLLTSFRSSIGNSGSSSPSSISSSTSSSSIVSDSVRDDPLSSSSSFSSSSSSFSSEKRKGSKNKGIKQRQRESMSNYFEGTTRKGRRERKRNTSSSSSIPYSAAGVSPASNSNTSKEDKSEETRKREEMMHRTLMQIKKELKDERSKEYDLGILMGDVLGLIQTEVEIIQESLSQNDDEFQEAEEETRKQENKKYENVDMEVFLLSLAQLKHIKDILLGGIEFDRPTIENLRKQNDESKKFLEEKKGVLKREEMKRETEQQDDFEKMIEEEMSSVKEKVSQQMNIDGKEGKDEEEQEKLSSLMSDMDITFSPPPEEKQKEENNKDDDEELYSEKEESLSELMSDMDITLSSPQAKEEDDDEEENSNDEMIKEEQEEIVNEEKPVELNNDLFFEKNEEATENESALSIFGDLERKSGEFNPEEINQIFGDL